MALISPRWLTASWARSGRPASSFSLICTKMTRTPGRKNYRAHANRRNGRLRVPGHRHRAPSQHALSKSGLSIYHRQGGNHPRINIHEKSIIATQIGILNSKAMTTPRKNFSPDPLCQSSSGAMLHAVFSFDATTPACLIASYTISEELIPERNRLAPVEVLSSNSITISTNDEAFSLICLQRFIKPLSSAASLRLQYQVSNFLNDRNHAAAARLSVRW